MKKIIKSAFPPVLNLSSLNGTNGFTINGSSTSATGFSVSGVGDVNGDGIADVAIGAPGANKLTGQSYIVFGGKSNFPAALNTSSLNGKNGFVINGVKPNDEAGTAVNWAGDINADGVDDLIISAVNLNNNLGQSYAVFGSKLGFPAIFKLASLNGKNGFIVNSTNPADGVGISVSGAGDVNADGIDDFTIGTYNGNTNVGYSDVIFGNSKGFPAVLNLAKLNGNNGFAINGVASYEGNGCSVGRAGDVNADSITDIIISSCNANDNTGIGQGYVIFGNSGGFSANFNLTSLNGNNGFAIDGAVLSTASSWKVNGAGDVNGDGIADIVIGVFGAMTNNNSGQSYVIFGNKSGFSSTFNLSNLNGKNGFTIDGINTSDNSGYSVGGAGDVNDDGIDDLIIGAYGANNLAGQGYVIFGSKQGFPATINLAYLNGMNGFAIDGINTNDHAGFSLSAAGDVNADGIGDLIIGAFGANNIAGQAYVIFGQSQHLVEEVVANIPLE